VCLIDDGEAIVLQPLHQPQLPQRFGAIEPLREDPAHRRTQLIHGAGCGQSRMPHVVLEVEAGIVDPQRQGDPPRRERQLLPVARHQVEARLHMFEEVCIRRR
jgi:hypothetical protein